jgi:hypothetical protein
LIRHQKNHCFKEENNKKSAKAQIAAAQIAQSLSSEDSNSSIDINHANTILGNNLQQVTNTTTTTICSSTTSNSQQLNSFINLSQSPTTDDVNNLNNSNHPLNLLQLTTSGTTPSIMVNVIKI